MDSARDDPCGPGCPIRRSPDQSLLATPRNFSQPATSFFASRRQGIHQTPFSCLISTLCGKRSMRRSRRAKARARPRTRTPSMKTRSIANAHARMTDVEAKPPIRTGPSIRVHASPPCQKAGRRRPGPQGPARAPKTAFPHLRAASPQTRRPANCPAACQPADQPTGGAERVRTDDLLLAKQALSQLSYSPGPQVRRTARGSKSARPPEWWAWVDSNYRPHAYQACALTA